MGENVEFFEARASLLTAALDWVDAHWKGHCCEVDNWGDSECSGCKLLRTAAAYREELSAATA